ncbi:carboxypeptidase regulatory-like domain-containing protein [Paraliomyxa miuraensis]|uniref:carboxypeptidase regulatory-like domain-containing protein n=1 Tax=Paraliomyxa miuraensis TaxID=376150 RepID=UPI00224D7141|nr:carboxypeptidase regulatory-like domain-containing protein [Paraliomyxa miuraensis]MCX4247076.1 carboxypeptidase regulatory-like domain-containing protein [Paraliomyxa miuraensis]
MSTDRPRWPWWLAALVVLVAMLAWWWPAAPEPEREPSTEASHPPAATARRRSPRPPPRHPGIIEAPSASVHEDVQAPAGALAGTVISWLDASPVPDAELTFMGVGTIHSVVTDHDGRFVFEAPEPGPYTLASVLADGFLPYAPELGQAPLHYVARPEERVEGATIELRPELELVVRIEDPRSTPVPGAEVRWLGIGTGEAALADDDDTYVSDRRGELRLTARLDAWLEARHDPLGVGRARVDEHALSVGTLVITLSPDAPAARATIAGRVLDPVGEPLPGARVLSDPASDEPSAEAVTDEDGAFVLHDLVPGPHRVEARHPGFAPVWASGVPAGADALVLQLSPGASIVGTIALADGTTIPGATVVALRHTGRLARASQAQTTVFDTEGEYRLDGLPPGTYDVIGGAAGHALVRVSSVELDASAVEVPLVLPAGGTISGRVIDERTGAPVPRARVEVERSLGAGASVAPLRASALSDDEGRFEIRGVEPGRCSIHAYALDHVPRAISGLQVVPGADAGPVEIALRPGSDGVGERFDFVGIGVMVRVDGDALRVTGLVEGGGAERAGLLEGDRLLSVDGVPLSELIDFGEAVQALRGREGTEVLLQVQRGEDEIFEVIVIRSRLQG